MGSRRTRKGELDPSSAALKGFLVWKLRWALTGAEHSSSTPSTVFFNLLSMTGFFFLHIHNDDTSEWAQAFSGSPPADSSERLGPGQISRQDAATRAWDFRSQLGLESPPVPAIHTVKYIPPVLHIQTKSSVSSRMGGNSSKSSAGRNRSLAVALVYVLMLHSKTSVFL